MTAPQGPFLYDDGPAPLHTGTPRAARVWLVLGMLGVLALAVLMLGGIFVFKGSGDEQATQVTGVFLAALDAGDTETTHGLLCEEERARLAPGEVASEYGGAGRGEVVEVRDHPVEGAREQLVGVRWEDGGTTQFTVIGEDGPRICGIG
ncbi:hypothetical protein [Blastococcus sp. SYSU D01042]